MPRPTNTAATAPGEAPAKVKKKAAPPLLEYWVPAVIRQLIQHAPTNPSLRGLIRNELHLSLPDTVTTAPKITEWLMENYEKSLPYKQGTIRPQVPIPTGLVLQTDGSLRIDNIVLRGVESGLAQYSCGTTYTGRMIIPAEVVRRGYDAVLSWFEAASIDGLTFSTDNYEHRNFSVERSTRSLYAGLSQDLFAAVTNTPVNNDDDDDDAILA